MFYKPLLVCAFVLFLSAFVYLGIRELSGVTKVGRVNSAEDLPVAQDIVAEFAPKGELRFYLNVSRDGYEFAASGSTTTKSFETFRRDHSVGVGTVNEDVLGMLDRFIDDEAIFRGFASDEDYLTWPSSKGMVYFFFDSQSERFTILIVAHRAERERWFPGR